MVYGSTRVVFRPARLVCDHPGSQTLSDSSFFPDKPTLRRRHESEATEKKARSRSFDSLSLRPHISKDSGTLVRPLVLGFVCRRCPPGPSTGTVIPSGQSPSSPSLHLDFRGLGPLRVSDSRSSTLRSSRPVLLCPSTSFTWSFTSFGPPKRRGPSRSGPRLGLASASRRTRRQSFSVQTSLSNIG